MRNIFLFDLDSTITKEEILPKIAKTISKTDEMQKLTELTMQGERPFNESFTQRVKILSSIPISEVQQQIEKILLNEELVQFIKTNKKNCYIVTGNLDIWIHKLLEKMDMVDHCLCSKAKYFRDNLLGIDFIIDKKEAVSQFKDCNIIAVGDGNNDAEMISMANIGIGFGGVRPIAPSVIEVCSHAIYNEKTLVKFLTQFIGE